MLGHRIERSLKEILCEIYILELISMHFPCWPAILIWKHVQFLSMKLAAVNPRLDFHLDSIFHKVWKWATWNHGIPWELFETWSHFCIILFGSVELCPSIISMHYAFLRNLEPWDNNLLLTMSWFKYNNHFSFHTICLHSFTPWGYLRKLIVQVLNWCCRCCNLVLHHQPLCWVLIMVCTMNILFKENIKFLSSWLALVVQTSELEELLHLKLT